MPDKREHKPQPAVTVLTGDEGTITLARSMLEAFGIPCAVRGEGVQGLYGAGALGTGFSLAFGPAAIEVPEEFAAEAKRLLQGLRRGSARRYVRRDRRDRPRRR